MINRELIRLKVVQLVYSYYQNEGKAFDIAEKELDFSLHKAYELYQSLLWILVETKKVAERKDSVRIARETRTGDASEEPAFDKIFADNLFLNQLAENKILIQYRESRKGDWTGEDGFARKLYTKFVESEIFQLYTQVGDFSYEVDRELVRKLYKTFVVNNEDFDNLVEDLSLYWNDDKYIIDSFVLKTIKRFDPKKGADQELLPLFDVEEDRTFARQLFLASLERGSEIRQYIREHTKNWEFSRLAFMDVIIMQIALAEILIFDNIPLNVTFNEYLDIAKIYSTPHSASYINGMLDNIVKHLAAEGRTMKQREYREPRKPRPEGDNAKPYPEVKGQPARKRMVGRKRVLGTNRTRQAPEA